MLADRDTAARLPTDRGEDAVGKVLDGEGRALGAGDPGGRSCVGVHGQAERGQLVERLGDAAAPEGANDRRMRCGRRRPPPRAAAPGRGWRGPRRGRRCLGTVLSGSATAASTLRTPCCSKPSAVVERTAWWSPAVSLNARARATQACDEVGQLLLGRVRLRGRAPGAELRPLHAVGGQHVQRALPAGARAGSRRTPGPRTPARRAAPRRRWPGRRRWGARSRPGRGPRHPRGRAGRRGRRRARRAHPRARRPARSGGRRPREPPPRPRRPAAARTSSGPTAEAYGPGRSSRWAVDGLGHAGIARREDRRVVDEAGEQG